MADGRNGFGVYVHWPFCESKCPYCDFNSHVRSSVDEDRWRAAYIAEIQTISSESSAGPAETVFFGGGTPSRMAPGTAAAVLEAIAAGFGLAPDAEITLEANPSSSEAARFRGFRAAGVNRLSLGVQSLDDAGLIFLGRTHDAAEARGAMEAACAAFPRVSFDLIAARPGLTEPAWRAELAEALAYGTGHLSVYHLTLEAGTPFSEAARRGRLRLPGDDDQAAVYEATQELCAAAGLAAYEVSNHARPGAECRHNLLYWRSGDWEGIGPGAHGRRTTAGGRTATRAVRSPERWLAAVEQRGGGLEAEDVLGEDAVLEEALLMGLRTSEGLDAGRFERQTGRPLDRAFGTAPASLAREGLLIRNGRALSATGRGRRVLDRVVVALAAAAETEAARAPAPRTLG